MNTGIRAPFFSSDPTVWIPRLAVFLLAAGILFCSAAPAAGQDGRPAAPPVDVREVHVTKDRPDENFPKAGTSIIVWVRDTTGILSSIVSDDTEITTFEDDAGTNLIEAHETAIDAWTEKKQRLKEEGHFVSTGRSRDLYETEGFGGSFSEDVPGFYLTIESWGLPASDATHLHVAGTVTYLVGLEETVEKRIPDVILTETTTFQVADQVVEVVDAKTRDDRKQFTVKTPLAVESFEIQNDEEETIGDIRMTVNDQPIVDMPDSTYSEPVSIVVSYKKPRERRVDFDREVSIGLP